MASLILFPESVQRHRMALWAFWGQLRLSCSGSARSAAAVGVQRLTIDESFGLPNKTHGDANASILGVS